MRRTLSSVFSPRTTSVWVEEYAPYAPTVLQARAHFVRVARSFWLIPELIPPIALDDVALLYAVCRQLDDAVDDAPTLDQARAALAEWKGELLGQTTPRPLIAAFLKGVPRTGLPLVALEGLLSGMQADLELVRLADDRALLRYCYQVSSCVGLLLAPLLGVAGLEGTKRVVDLGVGLQVSNILLGVAADARRNRVYVPATRLAEVGLSPADVLAHPQSPRLLPVLQGLAELGDRYYRSAQQGAATVPLRYRHGVLLLGRVYGELGRRAAHQLEAPTAPMGLSRRERLRQLALLAVAGAHPRVLGWSSMAPHEADLHQALQGLPGLPT